MVGAVAEPRPERLSLPVLLSLGLHGAIVGLVIAMPHLQGRQYIQVPVTYVNLVSATPGGGPAAGPAKAPGPTVAAPPAPAKAPAPAPPAIAAPPKHAPAARPAPPRVHEELSLPGRRKAPARTREAETPLTPPVPPREAARPGPPAAAPAPPVAAPPAPATTPGPQASVGGGGAAGGGADVGVEGGSGAGGSALGVYFALLQGKLVPIWEMNQPRDLAGTSREASVGVTIFRNGAFRDATIVQSSGDRQFDQAALRSVFQAQRFPPFPPLVKEESISVRLRFFVMEGPSG